MRCLFSADRVVAVHHVALQAQEPQRGVAQDAELPDLLCTACRLGPWPSREVGLRDGWPTCCLRAWPRWTDLLCKATWAVTSCCDNANCTNVLQRAWMPWVNLLSPEPRCRPQRRVGQLAKHHRGGRGPAKLGHRNFRTLTINNTANVGNFTTVGNVSTGTLTASGAATAQALQPPGRRAPR